MFFKSNMSATKFKVYDVDGPLGGPAGGDPVVDQKSKAIFAAAARRRDAGHNERYPILNSGCHCCKFYN